MGAVSAPHGGPAPHYPLGPPPPRLPHLQRPHEVQVAVYLWIMSLVLGLVSSVVTFPAMKQQFSDELHKQWASTPDLATADTGTLATLIIAVIIVLGLLIHGFFIVKLAGGRRWARIVLTVIGVLSVVGAVLGVRSAGPVDAALSVVDALLIAAAVVYMYSEGAKAYFTQRPGK